MNNKMKKNILFSCIVLITFTFVIMLARTYKPPYRSLFFMDTSFFITYEPVGVEDIGVQIGQVKVLVGKYEMPTENYDSNCLPVGTKIFSIKNRNDYDEILVENRLKDSIQEEPYLKAYVVRSNPQGGD